MTYKCHECGQKFLWHSRFNEHIKNIEDCQKMELKFRLTDFFLPVNKKQKNKTKKIFNNLSKKWQYNYNYQ